MKKSLSLYIYTCILFLIFFSSCKSSIKKEKRSQIDSSSVSKRVTIQDVEQGIRANINAQIKAGDGYFAFWNDSIELSLKLVRVHTEYLSVLGSNEFFACVDLATENGDVYDVDFFLEGTIGNMKVIQTDVHKLNGKPYYAWEQGDDNIWHTIPVENAGSELLGVIESADRFTFTYEVQLPELNESAEIWLPLAQSDSFQRVEILSIDAPAEYRLLTEGENKNSILYLKLMPKHAHDKIMIQYQVQRIEKSAYTEETFNPKKYLKATSLNPVGDRFEVISSTVIESKQADTPLMKARALYDYIIDNMRYAKEGIYGTGDANYACDSKSGNCTEFHSFFISLARSAGIPSRFAVGASIPSERNEGGIDGYHCWAEFYAEGKWWPIDISEANKYTPLATYYFGHHPANRIEFSRGRDLRPVPLPQSGPINFLAYPIFEIGGKMAYVETTFSFKRETSII
jgi:transglutaminase-like putative cysteine protease